MSSAHFHGLPTVALQLAVTVEDYRRAMRALARDPVNAAARNAVSKALRCAGLRAFAIPALWPAWGELMLRHSRLVQEWRGNRPTEQVALASEHLQHAIESLAHRCVAGAGILGRARAPGGFGIRQLGPSTHPRHRRWRCWPTSRGRSPFCHRVRGASQ